jgi:exonuclease VII small subunit
MDILNITETAIVYPKPGTKTPGILDIADIMKSISRIPEVEFVTRSTAPDLLADFNVAMSELNKCTAFVRYERDRASNLLEQRRSLVLLDLSGDECKRRGQNPTKELREAVVCLDLEHQVLQDQLAQLEALVKYMEGMMKTIESAYQSVKKILGDGKDTYIDQRNKGT